MEDQIINFETAKLASEVGLTRNGIILKNNTFVSKGITCSTCYNENGKLITPKYILEKHLVAPTQSLLQKWLREKHFIDVIIFHKGRLKGTTWTSEVHIDDKLWYTNHDFENNYTYEEALEIGLLEALKYLKLCQKIS